MPIAALEAGTKYSEFRINDTLADFLEYTKGSVVLFNKAGLPVSLTAGTDYTLTSPTGSGGVEVVLNLEAPGLEKVDDNIGGRIVLTIEAAAIGTGSTANVADITVNGKTVTGPEVVDPEEFFAGAHSQACEEQGKRHRGSPRRCSVRYLQCRRERDELPGRARPRSG